MVVPYAVTVYSTENYHQVRMAKYDLTIDLTMATTPGAWSYGNGVTAPGRDPPTSAPITWRRGPSKVHCRGLEGKGRKRVGSKVVWELTNLGTDPP